MRDWQQPWDCRSENRILEDDKDKITQEVLFIELSMEEDVNYGIGHGHHV